MRTRQALGRADQLVGIREALRGGQLDRFGRGHLQRDSRLIRIVEAKLVSSAPKSPNGRSGALRSRPMAATKGWSGAMRIPPAAAGHILNTTSLPIRAVDMSRRASASNSASAPSTATSRASVGGPADGQRDDRCRVGTSSCQAASANAAERAEAIRGPVEARPRWSRTAFTAFESVVQDPAVQNVTDASALNVRRPGAGGEADRRWQEGPRGQSSRGSRA